MKTSQHLTGTIFSFAVLDSVLFSESFSGEKPPGCRVMARQPHLAQGAKPIGWRKYGAKARVTSKTDSSPGQRALLPIRSLPIVGLDASACGMAARASRFSLIAPACGIAFLLDSQRQPAPLSRPMRCFMQEQSAGCFQRKVCRVAIAGRRLPAFEDATVGCDPLQEPTQCIAGFKIGRPHHLASYRSGNRRCGRLGGLRYEQVPTPSPVARPVLEVQAAPELRGGQKGFAT